MVIVFNYCLRIYWLVFLLETLGFRQGILSLTAFKKSVVVASLG